MANVQLVRQREIQRNPITTTKVDQAQSLQLVQTMLHGAMSTLTYSRGLFPTKAFKECFYDSQDTTIPYETLAKGALPTLKAEAISPSTKVPVLMRQQSRRADRFLDWLVSNHAGFSPITTSNRMLTDRRRKAFSKRLSPASFALFKSSYTRTMSFVTRCSKRTLLPFITPLQGMGGGPQVV